MTKYLQPIYNAYTERIEYITGIADGGGALLKINCERTLAAAGERLAEYDEALANGESIPLGRTNVEPSSI